MILFCAFLKTSPRGAIKANQASGVSSNKVEEHFLFVILTMEFLSQHFVLKDKTLIMYWTAILFFSNIAKGLDDRIKVSVLPLIQLY